MHNSANISSSQPRVPDGQRIYAIGDMHGCLDLLKDLMAKIAQDQQDSTAPARLIFLGDYIDRGLSSRQVIEYLLNLNLTPPDWLPPDFLIGNHEQVMRDILNGQHPEMLENWLRFGGRTTLQSYGIRPQGELAAMISALHAKVPPSHVNFLENLSASVTYGDYFFCHAGVRPGRSLMAQTENDLVWIRHEFLDHVGAFEKTVVHGHTIFPNVALSPQRIGVDTGAYATGHLSALALEGNKQWVIQTT
ncbi:MAG: metallophosphoesterase family protein [Bdellovibrionales bacterium]